MRVGKLYIEAGRARTKRGPLWIPDGLHLWWGDRGVHLWWSKSGHYGRVMCDSLDESAPPTSEDAG